MWLSLLGLVPGLLGAWTSWQKNKFDAQVQSYQARMGASRDVAVAAIQATAAVATKWWFVAAGEAAIVWSVAILLAKEFVWDKVVGSFVGCNGHTLPGTCTSFMTDPLGGNLDWVVATVVLGCFGAGIANRMMNTR